MKGGYQIINLSNTMVEDPVTVPGIYDMAKENHGKSVMLYTPDAQRVFAQVKKVDGVYKTTYLSAEGNVVIVEIASNDAVTTTITNPTSSIVGLEVAVNDLSETKAARADISSIVCTGSANTTGETIATGRYFYLNGALCKAKVDIANNATFTLNTNFTVVTIDEELSALNSNIVNLNTTWTNIFHVKQDGEEMPWTSTEFVGFSGYREIAISSGANSAIENLVRMDVTVFANNCISPTKAFRSVTPMSGSAGACGAYYIDGTHLGILVNKFVNANIWLIK